jgi:hypothetical protein
MHAYVSIHIHMYIYMHICIYACENIYMYGDDDDVYFIRLYGSITKSKHNKCRPDNKV